MSSKKAAKRNKKKVGKGKTKTGDEGAAKLVLATQDGDCTAITGLLDSGLDINALVETKDKDGKIYRTTALREAIAHKHEAAVRLLLDRGADPNLADNLGSTPLMVAAAQGFLPLMRLLLEAKAEVNAVDPQTGGTAFHWTCGCDHADCTEALVRAGCDTSLRDEGGMTGRDLAQEKGHTAVLERLDALEQGSSEKTTDSSSVSSSVSPSSAARSHRCSSVSSERSRSSTAVWPFARAMSRPVLPSLDRRLVSQPARTSASAHLGWPLPQTAWKAVK